MYSWISTLWNVFISWFKTVKYSFRNIYGQKFFISDEKWKKIADSDKYPLLQPCCLPVDLDGGLGFADPVGQDPRLAQVLEAGIRVAASQLSTAIIN